MDRLRELRDAGKIEWIEEMTAWAGRLDDIVRALGDAGFQECRKEIVRSRRDRQPAGGLWQGLNQRTGVVASAVWINGTGPRHSIIFVDIDGEPLTIECEVP
jgi:hypothetical protein